MTQGSEIVCVHGRLFQSDSVLLCDGSPPYASHSHRDGWCQTFRDAPPLIHNMRRSQRIEPAALVVFLSCTAHTSPELLLPQKYRDMCTNIRQIDR